MYGDYSRGHEPDRKRGRNYRRVLLQMGRPVLDSDFASMVDALLGEVRATTRGLSCAAASPDLGFLVTPGRLLTVFAEVEDGLTVTQGTLDAWIDYRYRFAARYPALHLAATGTPARVTLPLLQPLDPADGPTRAALWARVEAATTIQVNGIPVSLSPGSSDEPQRVEFATGSSTLDPLEIEVAAGDEVWLFLLEQDEVAGNEPAFWLAPGSYHIDGLVADAQGGGRFPSVAFPDAAGFPWSESPQPGPPLNGLLAPGGLSAGTRLVTYLELWERHITAVEDPGIREEALGATDTAARAELVGQVKLATLTGVLPDGAAAAGVIRAAFDAVEASGGLLTIDVPDTTPTTDPCALPDLAGYSGSDNRLYRIEVHQGGGLSQVRLKWSRDNGSELFEARLDDSQNFVFDVGTPLAAGDIVEVLSNVVDLGDDALARVSAGGFVPARRAVGQLAQLAAVEVASSSDEVVFRLVEPDNVANTVTLDDRYGTLPDAVLKLRRWHGILDPQQLAGGGAASPGPHVLEDGISVELSSTGSYRPGQWWQYEARVRGENANGPWRPAPHGPERCFAPLALLEFEAADQPLRLLAWLDERFSHPCDLDADDVAFAGGRVGSTSDTVQEAIEELFERPDRSGTCTVTVAPSDDLVAALAELPAAGGELCFQAGVYDLRAPLVVSGRTRVVLHGAGPATVLRARQTESALLFENCSEIAVRTLRVEGALAETSVAREHLNGAITFVGGGEVSVSDCFLSCPDAQPDSHGHVSASQTCLTARGGTEPLRIRLERNRFEVGMQQAGVLLIDPAHAYIAGNGVRVAGARDLPTGRVADQGIVVGGGSVGTIEVLDNLVEQTIQGIHVAASGPAAGREAADAVLLSRNVVHARVPAAHKRGRHAIFVGNAHSVHVKDTIATLERTGKAAPTPVDAIRLQGVFGPFVAVRQTSVRNFGIGVRVEPLEPLPSPRMWLVADTMAEGASLGADVPESVQHERNYPEHPVVAILTLEPAMATRGVGTPHTITATARDASGRAIAGVDVYFSALGANPHEAHAVTTDAAGAASLSYTGVTAGHDTIRAFADSNGNGRQDADEPLTLATVDFVSATPASVQLAQSADSSLRGSAVVVTATVQTASGAPSPDAHVVFSVTGANSRAAQMVATNASGQASITHTGPNAGTDTIRAFVDLNANDQLDAGEPQQTITHVFQTPVAASVTLLPPSGIAPVGAVRLYTATARDAAGAPVPGTAIRFVVTGANPHTASATTDANGVATHQYTGTNAGSDTIIGFADLNGNGVRDANEPQAQATQTFEPLPGPQKTSVPDLESATEDQAATAIFAAGLVVGTVTRPTGGDSRLTPIVISQSPAANALVDTGTPVNFRLARVSPR